MVNENAGKTFTIDISKLVPGLVLAKNIIHHKTGALLIPGGTMITDYHLKRISAFAVAGKCVVHDPKNINIDAGEAAEDWAKAKIKPLPPTIDEQAKKIYLETFETMKKFFRKDIITDEQGVREMMGAAVNITEEIMRDPYVLPQIAVLKAIDNYTFSHSLNVAVYAATLARFLGYKTGDVREICFAGLLHDIGKMDIPREIVDKPGPLTEGEFMIMKKHVRHSYERLKNIKSLNSNIIAAVSQHHEKVNGRGYYLGLDHTRIHDWASILAIADVYDALTTDRVYRAAMLPHEGAEVVMGSTLDHLDFDKVKVFTREMSLYPMGTRVALSTGDTGCIISHHAASPLRPIIQINKNPDLIIDLSLDRTTFITAIIKDKD